jgi:tRNA pseudouridine55 synthase
LSRRLRKQGRDISGVLILDKPTGPSSNQILQNMRHLYQARKAGHTGVLDPLASGVLPICFGAATRYSQYLLDSDKTYDARVLFGLSTVSGDMDGEVLARADVERIDVPRLEAALAGMKGVQQQTAPLYSALKVDGRPMYALARSGIQVERKVRQIQVYALDLLSVEGPEIVIRVRCSKGTYIRSLAETLGEAMGLPSVLTALRRTGSAGFVLDQAYTPEAVRLVFGQQGFSGIDGLLQPVDDALRAFESLQLDEKSAYDVRRGLLVSVQSASAGTFRLYTPCKTFIGLGEVDTDGQLSALRLMPTAQTPP